MLTQAAERKEKEDEAEKLKQVKRQVLDLVLALGLTHSLFFVLNLSLSFSFVLDGGLSFLFLNLFFDC